MCHIINSWVVMSAILVVLVLGWIIEKVKISQDTQSS